jgi:DNA-binding response OmpR family regulator
MNRILIIDDDEQLGRSIARIVQREGHRALLIESPSAAERRENDVPPDLVVVELQEPWAKGIPRLRRVLRDPSGRPIPFIFTIGNRELYRTIHAISEVGDDWLGKPFDPEELAVRVGLALRRSETQRPDA